MPLKRTGFGRLNVWLNMSGVLSGISLLDSLVEYPG